VQGTAVVARHQQISAGAIAMQSSCYNEPASATCAPILHSTSMGHGNAAATVHEAVKEPQLS
jgi:hypothetical protein